MRDATHYAATVDVPADQLAAVVAARYAAVPLDPAAGTAAARHAVPVVANHGRWVVTCPDCHGALLAHPADPRFLCVDCGNAAIGGKYRPVTWPKQHERIGEILDARGAPSLRNWLPGETVVELEEENALLGQGAPVLLEPPDWQHPRWQGHTHAFPKRLDGDVVECRECRHPFPRGDVEADRKAAS